jgi:curli biogenesis system outer membrane secretion channel CsgG
MSTSSRGFPGARRCLALLLPLALGACATTAGVRGGGGGDLNAARLEPYDGPRARIAVAAFTDKTAKGGGEIGEGMATMLTTALVNSNRFIVLERDELNEVLREQDLGASGRVRAGTEAPVGQIEGAELLAIGAVTAFEPEHVGVGGGIIGLGTLIGSAILNDRHKWVPVGAATYKESFLSIEVRLVDAATSRVLFTTTIDAKGIDWGGGVIAEVGGGRSRLPLAFGGFQNTATEKAVRQAIDVAVAELARRTPTEYFRHRADEFASGRMAAFAYVDLEGISGERFEQRGLRVASSAAEWATLAAELGLAGAAAAPPVDFSVQRVAAVFAGAQGVPGKSVSVEKAVAFPDRIELTAAVVDAPPQAEGLVATPAALHPMALVRLEKGAPVKLTWETKQP